MASVIDEKAHYMVVELTPATVEVRKYLRGEGDDADWGEVQTYVVRDKKQCNCKDFEFRNHECKHIKFAKEEGLDTKPVSLAEARRIAASVLSYLEKDFLWIGLEDAEPYTKDAAGNVTAIRMEAKSRTLVETARLFVLADGLLIRIRIVGHGKKRT